MTADPAAIARRLTPAQKRALRLMHAHTQWQPAAPGTRWAMRLSLLVDVHERIDRWWRLTALGLRVREILVKVAAAHER